MTGLAALPAFLATIPPHWRERLYSVGLAVSAILAAAQVAFLASGAADPVWFKVALAVAAACSAALHLTAGSNVPPETPSAP